MRLRNGPDTVTPKLDAAVAILTRTTPMMTQRMVASAAMTILAPLLVDLAETLGYCPSYQGGAPNASA